MQTASFVARCLPLAVVGPLAFASGSCASGRNVVVAWQDPTAESTADASARTDNPVPPTVQTTAVAATTADTEATETAIAPAEASALAATEPVHPPVTATGQYRVVLRAGGSKKVLSVVIVSGQTTSHRVSMN